MNKGYYCLTHLYVLVYTGSYLTFLPKQRPPVERKVGKGRKKEGNYLVRKKEGNYLVNQRDVISPRNFILVSSLSNTLELLFALFLS